MTTYDGGLYVLDGETLKVAKDIPLEGFNRINPAGDDRHVMVSTGTGFRVLDAAEPCADRRSSSPRSKPDTWSGTPAGRCCSPTGPARSRSSTRSRSPTPRPRAGPTSPPRRTTVSRSSSRTASWSRRSATEEKRVGIVVLDTDRKEIARNEDCPGVHGEATAKDEVVVIGCQDGVLIYKGGTITKVKSPTPYGRIGNQAGLRQPPGSCWATTSRTRTPSWSGRSRSR